MILTWISRRMGPLSISLFSRVMPRVPPPVDDPGTDSSDSRQLHVGLCAAMVVGISQWAVMWQ